MGAYQYQAIKKSGSTLKGVIEADSERHARQLIREQGLIPTQINTLKKTNIRYCQRIRDSCFNCIFTSRRSLGGNT